MIGEASRFTMGVPEAGRFGYHFAVILQNENNMLYGAYSMNICEIQVLAIDPGTENLGWCVVCGNQRAQRFIDGGVARVASAKTEMGLKKIFDAVSELICKFHPDTLVVESPFFGKNTKTLIRLGEARGAILLAAALANVRVAQLTPAEAKLALTGNGNARKEQVAYMVKMILAPTKDLALDASDAAAVAVAFLHKYRPTTMSSNP